MSHARQVLEGAFAHAIGEVSPQVPEIVATPYHPNLLRRITRQEPDDPRVRLELIDVVQARGHKVDLRDLATRHAVVKAEAYTFIGGLALPMRALMVEGTGRSARIRDQARPRLDIDFRMNLRMCFGQGYNSVAAGNPWVGRADIQYRQVATELGILRERHAPNPSLRSATSGGALGDTVTQLNILAGKLRRKQYNDTLAPGSPEDVWRAFCMRRIETMHDLAYLGLGRAGLNIEYVAALFSPGLGLLSGTLQTYDRPEGGTLTVFKRDSKKTWETVFPSPTAPDALGPTYKCPFHQSGPKEDGPSPLADFLPAAINLLGEQPRHLLNGDELRLLRYPAP